MRGKIAECSCLIMTLCNQSLVSSYKQECDFLFWIRLLYLDSLKVIVSYWNAHRQVDKFPEVVQLHWCSCIVLSASPELGQARIYWGFFPLSFFPSETGRENLLKAVSLGLFFKKVICFNRNLLALRQWFSTLGLQFLSLGLSKTKRKQIFASQFISNKIKVMN